MYAVIRNYSGSGASDLFALLEECKDEVDGIIGEVTGFMAHMLIRTDDGGATATVCQDKADTDESVQLRQHATIHARLNALEI